MSNAIITELNFNFSNGESRTVYMENFEFEFLGRELNIIMNEDSYPIFNDFFKKLENNLTSYKNLKNKIIDLYTIFDDINSQMYLSEMEFIFNQIENVIDILNLIRFGKINKIIC
jgi:hypothetical protein